MALEVALQDGVATVLATAGLAARAGAKATVKMNDAVTTGYVTITAKTNGYHGNGYGCIFSKPDVASSALRVDFDSSDKIINVYLATNGSKVATSTAEDVAHALAADADVAALFDVAHEGAGSGTAIPETVLYTTGGVDALTVATGGKVLVNSFDATNANILPIHVYNPEFYKGTDKCQVSVADLVTACTAP